MGKLSRLTRLAGFLVVTSAASGISQTRLAAATGASRSSARTDSLYSGVEKDFSVGRKVYLRSSKTLIGTILAIDPIHSFPPSFGRTRAKGLLIKRKDGPLDWIPIDGALRIYVVKH